MIGKNSRNSHRSQRILCDGSFCACSYSLRFCLLFINSGYCETSKGVRFQTHPRQLSLLFWTHVLFCIPEQEMDALLPFSFILHVSIIRLILQLLKQIICQQNTPKQQQTSRKDFILNIHLFAVAKTNIHLYMYPFTYSFAPDLSIFHISKNTCMRIYQHIHTH